MKIHASGEDYLEAILILHKKMDMVRSVDVARHLGVLVWPLSSPPRTHEVSCCGSPSNYQAMLQPSACSRIVMKRR